MSRNLKNNNNLRLQHLTAITYSLCCVSVGGDLVLNFIRNIETQKKKGRGKLYRVPNKLNCKQNA